MFGGYDLRPGRQKSLTRIISVRTGDEVETDLVDADSVGEE